MAVRRTCADRTRGRGRVRNRHRLAGRGVRPIEAVYGDPDFALIPGIVIRDLHQTNIALGGAIVFELGLVAAVVIVLGRRVRPAAAMTTGLTVLLPAVALVVIAQAARSMPLLFAATALAGVAMAFGYRGSLQVVNEIAPDERRAEVVSSYFIACFVGNSVPVIGVGLLSAVTGALPASIVFACTLAGLSIAALAWRRRSTARPSDCAYGRGVKGD